MIVGHLAHRLWS